MSLKASISGIRGIVGDSLTPQVIIEYINAFDQILTKGKILIGRDSRTTGKMILSIVKGMLNSLGRDVVDIGIVPTPVVLFGVANEGFAGGIIITASHNPEEWNALKLVNGHGKFLSPIEFQKISELIIKKDFKYKSYKEIGQNSVDENIKKDHIDKIFKYVDSNSIKRSKFRVVIDAVNGAGGPHTIDFLKKTGCEVIAINDDPTGLFSHPPEPTPKNLQELSKTVKKHKADIGFALDPDADRLVISDSLGEVLSEELTLALCIYSYLKYRKKTDIVINTSTSMIIEEIAKSFDVKVHRVPTGEINVTEKMEKIGSKIGGEGNGGIILPDINKCRDALVGIAMILELLYKEKKTLKELIADFPSFFLIKDKVKTDQIDISEINKRIELEFKGQNIDNQDGIRIDLGTKWVLLRKSNTEPIIRIFAESSSIKESESLISKVKKVCGF